MPFMLLGIEIILLPAYLVFDDDFLDLVALTDGINHFKTINHFAKTGVHTIQVRGIVTGVADKKL